MQRASHVGTELQPEKLEQGREPNVRRVMHLRCCGLTPAELTGVSGWQDVSDVQMDCLMRDIYR